MFGMMGPLLVALPAGRQAPEGDGVKVVCVPWQRFLLILCLVTPGFCTTETKTCSMESRTLLARASDCFDKEDFGCARLSLERLLARQPGCAHALYLQSFLLERDGREEDAQKQREKAVELDPTLKTFWEDRGHYIETEILTEQEFSHFVLKFNGGGNRNNAWKAVQHLNEAYDFLSSRFGEKLPKKVEVIVFTGQEFMEAWRAPFIGGFFDRRDGKVRVRVDEFPGGEDLFRHICRHEFTHAFLYQLYPKELPLWFVEGSAEFYGHFDTSTSFWRDEEMERIRKLVRGHPVPASLEEISDTIQKKTRGAMAIYLAYQYGYAITMYVAKERGDSWIPSLLRYLRAGQSFDQAFQSVVGYPPARAYEHLRQSWE